MPDTENRRSLLDATWASLDHHAASEAEIAKQGDRPPRLGDVYVLKQTADYSLDWVVVATDPIEPGRLLVAPADSNLLVGSADIEVPEDAAMGPLNLRCRFAGWIDAEVLEPRLRVGVLERGDVERTRQRWLEMGNGGLIGSVLEREVDEDPEYQDWVDNVLAPARRELFGATTSDRPLKKINPKTSTDSRMVFWRWSQPFAAAAAIALVAVAIGWWRLHERPPEYRNISGSTIEPRMNGHEALPRDNAWLRWNGPEDSIYDVLVMTEQMAVIAEASGLREPQFRIPEHDLGNLSAGTRLLWRIEARLPDGRRFTSSTFETKLR